MPRWMGFLGSWALLALALGLAAYAIAGDVINMRDLRRLERVAMIDEMIGERSGYKAEVLRDAAAARTSQVNALRTQLQTLEQGTNDTPDTGQTIIVSTEENKVWVHRNGQTVFEAVCSTGKGSTLAADGKTFVFDTPIGKLRIIAKEENPQWVPPDWHYIEQAKKNGMQVVHLNPGDALDARTGQPAGNRGGGIFFWLRSRPPLLKVKGNTVVVDDGRTQRELPPGQDIVAGNTIVIPPVTTKQRHYDKVLGKFRLELGNGYGIHGTDEPEKLGQSVSHGCVRLGDDDIAGLYQIANVGDTVIIY